VGFEPISPVTHNNKSLYFAGFYVRALLLIVTRFSTFSAHFQHIFSGANNADDLIFCNI